MALSADSDECLGSPSPYREGSNVVVLGSRPTEAHLADLLDAIAADWYDEPFRRVVSCTCLPWSGSGTVLSNVICLRCRLPLCG